MPKLIQIEDHDRIGIITLKRPEVLNALSRELLEELDNAVLGIEGNPNIGAVIFTGAGEVAFSAGADLKERQEMCRDETISFVKFIQSVFQKIANLKIPTIAALNGSAFGGGLELALACDLRVVDQRAKLGLVECSLGIIPGAGGTQRLFQIVGRSRALDLIMGAKRISAVEAYRIGLADYVNSGEISIIELAMSVSQNIVKNAPLAVRWAKWAVQTSSDRDIANGIKNEFDAYTKILDTEDRLEGLLSFKEKRPPRFLGR